MKNETLTTLLNSIKQAGKEKTSPYDTTAEVKRVEDGVAWVHIPGGIAETPVRMTVNAKPGDEVLVRVSGGRAYAIGNASSPPTDDGVAQKAMRVAGKAADSVRAAWDQAKNAAEAARQAWNSANEARAAADTAVYESGRASDYANSALAGLSTLESVIDTVNWFAEHKKESTDTVVDNTKTYYIYDSETGTLSEAEPQGTENPSEEGWYELDEAIANYIAARVAETDDGLHIVNVGGGWRVLISAGTGTYPPGVFIIDPDGAIAQASKGDGIEFSEYKSFHIGTDEAYLLFTPATPTSPASITLGGTNINIGGGQTLTQLLQQITNINSDVDKTNENLDKTTNKVDQIGSFVNVDTSDPTQPVMTLGSDQAAIYLQLVNDMLAFYAKGNDTPVAYINVDEETKEGVLNITNVIAVKEVRFGHWGWYERTNGNLSVKWIGADPTQEGSE